MEIPPDIAGYRFGRVDLDLARGCLRVDGIDVVATPLPMRLLALLCARGGELVTRDEMFEGIWPRQEVSDDALNKLISRLRELLGAEAEAIVTVRRQGLRLDAPVERVLRRTDPPAAPAPPRPEPGEAAAAEHRYRATPLLTLLLLLALAFAWREATRIPAAHPDATASVFDSYALRLADLHASRDETAGLLRASEQAMDRGDAALARQLLRSADESDPQSALLPALRAIHRGSDDPEPLAELVQRARQRLSPQDAPYTRLMVDYASATLSGDDAERAAVDALLTVRPQAWRLRLRRAHLDIQVGERAGALRHLRAFPLDGVPPATLMYVLADRASFGDTTEVERLLQGGLLGTDPLRHRYVELRLQWTRRDPACTSGFDALADDATAAGAFALAAQARELAAACAYAHDEGQADARLRRAAHALREGGRAEKASTLLGLAAEFAQRQGREDDARAWLESAASQLQEVGAAIELEVLNARLGLLPRGRFLDTAGRSDDRFGRGEPALVAGWYALRDGRLDQARAALDEARASGIERSPHAESADLLALRLGGEHRPCWIDPPYPDLLRMASCRELKPPGTPTR
jgi:DNA-binding winged helix-turn-helix (wHTH) protein